MADFARPAEKLSLTQNAALTATGLIWTRWCFVIRPKNYLYVLPIHTKQMPYHGPNPSRSLAAVNFFLAIVGIIQVSRIAKYEMSKNKSVAGVVEDVKQDVKENIKDVKV